ncbi:MAG TPA: S8 family peptidase [Limnobacter sp.]|nr:S8 family peptidase [Limnobacter sp.]
MRSSLLSFAFATVVSLAISSTAFAEHRLVIEFKDPARLLSGKHHAPRVQAQGVRMMAAAVDELARVHRLQASMVRPFGHHGAVVKVAESVDADVLLQRLASDPAVKAVALDRRIRLHAQSPVVGFLNAVDPSRRSRSWFHQDLQSQPASINTGAMWVRFHGSSPSVVAVLDTGVLPTHPMLQGHLLPGYDFVTDPAIGADAQGVSPSNSRDSDPSDPGDGVSFADLAADPACSGVSVSSWHGTFVSGLLAGNPIPAEGIFSVNWNASILPVRVLGKCGGFSSDLADGIRWAAGLAVAGAPQNRFPAKVINLSLGAEGACVPSIEGAAIADARRAGALVVVAAGNDGSTVDSPANCPGAFGVAAVDQEGLKASYSNFGASIQLTAPGGDSAFPIWSASNSGTFAPLTNTYNTKVGTSFSAPMVAAAASLYWSLNPSASLAQVESAIKSTSRPFPALGNRSSCTADQVGLACNCTTALCGAGMLDVANLIDTLASGGLTNLFSNSGNVIAPGASRTFSSEGSINSSGQPVDGVAFALANIQKSDASVPDPSLSVSGLTVEVTPQPGVQGFDLLAVVANGRTSIASITVENPGSSSPTLLASLLAPLLGITTDLGQPVSVGDGGVGDSGSGGATSASGGGGGAFLFAGLLGLVLLVACFKTNYPKNNVRTAPPKRDIAQW